MSFILKKIVSRLLSQYLNINENQNLEKGELLLSSGHLNQSNINKMLQKYKINAKVAYSEYTNLGITVPIT